MEEVFEKSLVTRTVTRATANADPVNDKNPVTAEATPSPAVEPPSAGPTSLEADSGSPLGGDESAELPTATAAASKKRSRLDNWPPVPRKKIAVSTPRGSPWPRTPPPQPSASADGPESPQLLLPVPFPVAASPKQPLEMMPVFSTQVPARPSALDVLMVDVPPISGTRTEAGAALGEADADGGPSGQDAAPPPEVPPAVSEVPLPEPPGGWRGFPSRGELLAVGPEAAPELHARAPWYSEEGLVAGTDLLPFYADGLGRLPGDIPLEAVETRDWRRRIALPASALIRRAGQDASAVRTAHLVRVNDRFGRTYHDYELFPIEWDLDTWTPRSEAEYEYARDLATLDFSDLPTRPIRRCMRAQLIHYQVLPSDFRTRRRDGLFWDSVREERGFRNRFGVFVPRQCAEVLGVVLAEHGLRFVLIPYWFADWEVPQGCLAELPAVVTYRGFAMAARRDSPFWTIFITEWVVNVCKNLLWDCYDRYCLWYTPDAVIEGAEYLASAGLLTVPLGGEENVNELMGLIDVVRTTEWDQVPIRQTHRSPSRNTSHSPGRLGDAGDFIYYDPFQRRRMNYREVGPLLDVRRGRVPIPRALPVASRRGGAITRPRIDRRSRGRDQLGGWTAAVANAAGTITDPARPPPVPRVEEPVATAQPPRVPTAATAAATATAATHPPAAAANPLARASTPATLRSVPINDQMRAELDRLRANPSTGGSVRLSNDEIRRLDALRRANRGPVTSPLESPAASSGGPGSDVLRWRRHVLGRLRGRLEPDAGVLATLRRVDADWVRQNVPSHRSRSPAATAATATNSGTPGRASANAQPASEVIDLVSDDEPEVKTEPGIGGAASASASAGRSDEDSLDAEIGRVVQAMLAAKADSETIEKVVDSLRERANRRG